MDTQFGLTCQKDVYSLSANNVQMQVNKETEYVNLVNGNPTRVFNEETTYPDYENLIIEPQVGLPEKQVSNVDLLPFSIAAILAREPKFQDNTRSCVPIAAPVPLVLPAPLVLQNLTESVLPVYYPARDVLSSPLSASPAVFEPAIAPAPKPAKKLPKMRSLLSVMKQKKGITMKPTMLADINCQQVSKMSLVPLESFGYEDSYAIIKEDRKIAVSSITRDPITGNTHIQGWTLAELKTAFGVTNTWDDNKNSSSGKWRRTGRNQKYRILNEPNYEGQDRFKANTLQPELPKREGSAASEKIDVATMNVEEETRMETNELHMTGRISPSIGTHSDTNFNKEEEDKNVLATSCLTPTTIINPYANYSQEEYLFDYHSNFMIFHFVPTPPTFGSPIPNDLYEESDCSPQSPLPFLQSEVLNQLMAPIWNHLIPDSI